MLSFQMSYLVSVRLLGDDGIRHYKFIYDGIFLEILDRLGEMPLPPYITEKLDDKNRYQTVYAKNPGSAAAPTAGLHFTKELPRKGKTKRRKYSLRNITRWAWNF